MMAPSSQQKTQARLDECYQRGLHLMNVEKNYDYAHTMFAQCVLGDASNLLYTESLLKNLRAKVPAKKKKLGLLAGNRNRDLKKAVSEKQWKAALLKGLELLKEDPWDSVTLRSLAEVCAQLHYNQVELAYLKQALESDPKNIDVNRHCAQSLARMGQFDQAIACWHRVETIRPGDREAAKMIGELSDEKMRYPNGRPPAPVQPVVPAAVVEQPEKKSVEETAVVVLTPRQRLERAIAEEPNHLQHHLKLAAFLVDAGDFADAERAILKAISLVGDHPQLQERLLQVQAARAEKIAAAAEERQELEEWRNRPPRPFPWLEVTLACAGIGLLMQLFPPVGAATLRMLDFRNWSRTTWFVFNILAVLALCVLRYKPQLKRWMEQRRKGRASNPRSAS